MNLKAIGVAFTIGPGRTYDHDPSFGVIVPGLPVAKLFDDAFTALARDGAGTVEVVVRLQNALETLAAIGDRAMRESAERHARLALTRAESAMTIREDLDAARNDAAFALATR